MPFPTGRGSTRGSRRGGRSGSSGGNGNGNGNGDGNGTFRGTHTSSSWKDTRLGSSGSGSGSLGGNMGTGGNGSTGRPSRDREISPAGNSSRPIHGNSGGFGRSGDSHTGASSGRDAGRTMSNSWGRLKPVNTDPLDELGLPSKGDTRLLDSKTQERYYTKIVERYMSFCSKAGQRDELLRRFAALDLQDSNPTLRNLSGNHHHDSTSTNAPLAFAPLASSAIDQNASATTSEPITSPNNNKDLSMVVSALRKLREGIVASKRADNFAVQAYLFCIRLCVLVQHPEGYQPAALHLLRRIHPLSSLTSSELTEVVGYLVLDAACRRAQLAEAYAMRREYKLNDPKIDALLQALAQDNYVLFRKVKGSVDSHKARIMDFAEKDIRGHMLKCLGRAYFTVDRTSLETTSGASWEILTKEHGVGWELEGQTVVIRRVKQR